MQDNNKSYQYGNMCYTSVDTNEKAGTGCVRITSLLKSIFEKHFKVFQKFGDIGN